MTDEEKVRKYWSAVDGAVPFGLYGAWCNFVPWCKYSAKVEPVSFEVFERISKALEW